MTQSEVREEVTFSRNPIHTKIEAAGRAAFITRVPFSAKGDLLILDPN